MGFFSWVTQDTHKSIPNVNSNRTSFPITMTDNQGNKWYETGYGGYGDFGGKDFYVLVAEMNGGIEAARKYESVAEEEWNTRRQKCLAEKAKAKEVYDAAVSAFMESVKARSPRQVKEEDKKPVTDEPSPFAHIKDPTERERHEWLTGTGEFQNVHLCEDCGEYYEGESCSCPELTEEDRELKEAMKKAEEAYQRCFVPGEYQHRQSDGNLMRAYGIHLSFGKEPYLSPNLTEDPEWEWVNRAPETCEYQGYFYDNSSKYSGKHKSHPIYESGKQTNTLQQYFVSVTVTADEDDLDEEDPQSDEVYPFQATDEDHALEQFHDSVPISLLENYEIIAETASEHIRRLQSVPA